MQPLKLRFFARGTAKAFDLDRADAGVRRYIGRTLDRAMGFAERDENGNLMMTGGHPAMTEPDEVSNRAEHRQFCKEGALWAADQATAEACDVIFDPAYGGEYSLPKPPRTPSESKADKA